MGLREIVLDTETTGLDPGQGHRLVEVGAVELIDHVPTGRTFHSYVNPERDVPEDAFRVHGLSSQFLADYPPFGHLADVFLDFLEDSPLVIHNAAFDVRFLNAELIRVRRDPFPDSRGLCTVMLAQRRFPGSPVSLDALCRRFSVDASSRTLHGALIDCHLLAEVYLHLIGGRQTSLGLALPGMTVAAGPAVARTIRTPRPHAPTPAERTAHAAFVARMSDPVWSMAPNFAT